MPATASESVCFYGAREIDKHLSAMRAEVEGVRQGSDIEYVHRMRVASRRMRTALSLFSGFFPDKKHKKIIKTMRTVTSSLGEARDLDVQLALLEKVFQEAPPQRALPGLRRLQLRLKQQRAEAQSHVSLAMDRFSMEQTVETLQEWINPYLISGRNVYLFSPALYELAFTSIRKRVEELLAHEPYIYDPQEVTQLHAMRISAKRLRYTMEAFDDLYSGRLKPYINLTKDLQDDLGTLHDLDVWIAMIPRFTSEEQERIRAYYGTDGPLRRLLPGLRWFQQTRSVQREAVYASFIARWEKVKQQDTFENLLKLINAPFDLEQTLLAMRMQAGKPEAGFQPEAGEAPQESEQPHSED